MRLINAQSLELEDFFLGTKPQYAILSHTWGFNEVTYQDIMNGNARAKEGYTKIEKTCKLAITMNLSYVWVDTCCIDKTSSAELSEAINSMYRWYRDSTVCYAFLADVEGTGPDETMLYSRWFTRGWTLQELIAPRNVEFYNSQWQYICTRDEQATLISRGTTIDIGVLKHLYGPEGFSVAQRMSWAARRETTRIEDGAYCLLGIFSVNVSLIYGEGDNAFRRLLEAIITRGNDLTIFNYGRDGILPKDAASYHDQHRRQESQRNQEFALTNMGLKFTGIGALWRFKNELGANCIGIETGSEIFEGRHELLIIALLQIGPSIFVRARKYEWLVFDADHRHSLMPIELDSFHIVEDSSFYPSEPAPANYPILRNNYRLHLNWDFKIGEVMDAMPSALWNWAELSFFEVPRGSLLGHHDLVLGIRVRLFPWSEIGILCDFRRESSQSQNSPPIIHLIDNNVLPLDRIFDRAGGRQKVHSLSWYDLELHHPKLYSRSNMHSLCLNNVTLHTQIGHVRTAMSERRGRYDLRVSLQHTDGQEDGSSSGFWPFRSLKDSAGNSIVAKMLL